jgi:hypothetical protein
MEHMENIKGHRLRRHERVFYWGLSGAAAIFPMEKLLGGE